VALVRGSAVVLVVGLLAGAGACGGDGPDPVPPPTVGSSTTEAPTTTVARVPTLTAEPIAGLDPTALHRKLGTLGFTTGAPTTVPGFVTTTSQRSGATVSTYGKGPTEVVKLVAEVDRAAASQVLAVVALSATTGSEAKRAEAWVKGELRKEGPTSPTEPRSAQATYGEQPHELLVTTSTATLSIGRLSR